MKKLEVSQSALNVEVDATRAGLALSAAEY